MNDTESALIMLAIIMLFIAPAVWFAITVARIWYEILERPDKDDYYE